MATVDADQADSKVVPSDTGELNNERSDALAPDDVNDIANRKTLPASINGEPQAPNKSTEETTTEIETNQSTEDTAPQDSNSPSPTENPPLPQEEAPDDGWEPRWDPNNQAYYFYHAATNVSQWENPRVPSATQYPPSVIPAQGVVGRFYWSQYPIQANNPQLPTSSSAVGSSSSVKSGAAGRYNPSIHGSWDPTADYAKEVQTADNTNEFQVNPDAARDYIQAAHFNRWTGQNQQSTDNRHSDEAKSKRQMEAFFNVDLAANSHEGKSLKAERQSKKLSRKEVREYQARRREKKEEKRRAWLRD